MTRVDPKITIEELVEAIPSAPRILREFGLVCLQCGEPVWGTLEELAQEKGIQNLQPILEALQQTNNEREE